MEKFTIVLDANPTQNKELCRLLQQRTFPAVGLKSIPDLESYLKGQRPLVVIIDIDTVKISGPSICRFTKNFSDIYFFIISSHPFHPELADAIGQCIYACLSRPIDPDELFYWLESISKNNNAK